jgi:protein gp37
MKETKIEWCNHTFNPWWGCVKVAPECDHCYADTFAKRVGFSETGSQFPIWGKGTARRFFGDEYWAQPYKWDRAAKKAGERRRVFCGSMCDVMEEHPDLGPWREKLWKLIESAPNLDWLLLTKRPQNYKRFLPANWDTAPWRNVWLGTTCGHPDSLWRVAELLKTPAAVRFLSCEPLLAPLNLERQLLLCRHWKTEDSLPHAPWCPEDPGKYWLKPQALRGINQHIPDWIIAGAESGPGARPCEEQWVRSLKDQCVSAGVPFFYKQAAVNGRKIPTPELDGRRWVEFPVEAI